MLERDRDRLEGTPARVSWLTRGPCATQRRHESASITRDGASRLPDIRISPYVSSSPGVSSRPFFNYRRIIGARYRGSRERGYRRLFVSVFFFFFFHWVLSIGR